EEFRWVAKDGRIVWVETHSTVICDKSGQPIGYRGVNIDITERKRLEEERALLISELDSEKARLQHIFDNSPSFIVTLRGPDFVFEMANPAYYKLIGNRELIGFPAAEALPELATQDLPDILNHVYATGEPFFGNEMAVELQSSKNSPPTKHYINFVYMPLRDADNSISGIISYGMDVTEQVFSRFLIQESEERYRFLFENNPLPMWVFDLETLAFLSVNQAAIDHYGYSRKEFLSMSVKDIRPPEEIPSFLENVENDSPGIRKRGIFRHRKKDGTEIFVEKISNQIIFNGKTARLVLANDITERRKAEESIQFQAHLLNTVEQAIIATDLEGIVCYWNQFAEKLYGWTSAEVIGRNIKELTTPEINSLQASQIMTQLSTGKSWSGEFQVQNRNGDVFPVYISNSPIIDNDGKLTGIVGVSIDISERKQNEEILKQSERDYRTVFEQAHDAILIFAPEDEIILEVNERACEIYGFNRSEFIGMSIDTISKTPDYDREKVKKTLESREYFNFETVQYRKDGSEMFLEVNASKINYQGKQAIITINRDISERKLSEEALRQAEDKYRRLVELSPAIVYLAEPHPPFSTIYVSPNITRFGYSLEEWLVRADMWVSIIHKQDRARVIRATEEAIESGSETDLEYRVIARDGAIFWLHDKGRFIVDENGRKNGWQGVMVDITRTKELEEQLRQAQKLESVGLLAGGIAHDFNNMLTAINGYSDLTLRRLKPDDPLRLNIEEIKKAGQRSADLTQQLLAFSRQQMLQPVVLDLNDIISDTIKMLKRVIGEDIQLTTILNSKIGRVKVDPGQFSQIFMNLAVNARDSMPNGGKLTIETSNVFLDPDYARRHIGVLPGAYVMLSVSDTGIGMSDETKKHIF
ncbi:MAG TPA: PAS domain S-box protein, partial [Pyrinomonadaceae bacterium]|nr:PAS domain S-box protein [Pyrinomonadaceae bacterium]